MTSWKHVKKPLHVFLLTLLPIISAHAELPDVIDVLTDDLNEAGELSASVHVNSTPYGANLVQNYPDEVVTNHGIRLTPSIHYGLQDNLELSLSIPIVRDGNNGNSSVGLAGGRVRLTWISNGNSDSETDMNNHAAIGHSTTKTVRSDIDEDAADLHVNDGADIAHPWYWGTSASVLMTQQKYEYGKTVWDAGLIGGYHTSDWNLAANTFFSNGLNGLQHELPDTSFSTKLARRVTGTVWAGGELYISKAKAMTVDGAVWGMTRTLFGVLEFEGKKTSFSLGIGRGLNIDTDRWTLKSSFDFSF